MNFFLAESPLQLLNCIEAAESFPCEKKVLVIKVDKNENGKQIINLLNIYQWDEVIHFPDLESKNKIAKRFAIKKFLERIRHEYKNINLLFFGEFRSRWMQYLRCALDPDESFLIDDGDITLSIQELYFDNGKYYMPFGMKYYPLSFKEKIKIMIDDIFFISYMKHKILSEPVNLFTTFNIDNNSDQRLVLNSYKHLSKIKKTPSLSLGVVYYFGSKYSEAGVLSIEKEIGYIFEINKYFLEKKYKFFYIPHRGDSQKKLSKIKKHGIPVIKYDIPAEVALLKCDEFPEVISGACSSALNNLKCIFDNCKVISFLLPLYEVQDYFKDDLIRSYSNLVKVGVDVVDLYEQDAIY